MKSENLNFLEPSGPLRACNGIDLPFLQWKTPDDGTEELSETCRVLFQK